jgi:hypothetical protein
MMLYLMVAGGTALLTMLFTTDNYHFLVLPFLFLAQLDWGMVPDLIQCAQGTTQLLRGTKNPDTPSCIPDFAANLQILGLFNAHVECQNRVAVELAKRGSGNDVRSAAPVPVETGADAKEAAEKRTSGRTSSTTIYRVTRARDETRRLRAATSLAETIRSERHNAAPKEAERLPRWSCEGLRRATGERVRRECSATRLRSGRAASTAPRWRPPFRDNSSAA